MKRLRDIIVNRLSGALALSLLLHGLIVAALLITLPLPEPDAEPEEQVVEVTLVEPPEAPKSPLLEAPEPPPEPEVPEPEVPEPLAEPGSTEPPQPTPPAADAVDEAEGVPIPVLRPVFRFGEQDSGSELEPDGGAAEAPAEPRPNEVAPKADTAESQQPEEQQDQPEPAPDSAPTLALPLDITLPEADLDGAPNGLADAADETDLTSLPEDPADTVSTAPQAKPAEPVKPDKPADKVIETPADTGPVSDNGLPGVRKLSSNVNTGHAVATTAMGALPRGLRASQLCTSELREQLRNAPERFRLELLPSYRLDSGNVLTETNAAFRADGVWYSLSFRCTVDDEALQVTGFAHAVGQPIPRSEWNARGFPAF